jgi:DNA-3-methyladenine glycosylase II
MANVGGPRTELMTDSPWRKVQRHLARRDPVMKRLVAVVGPCTLWHQPEGFAALARAITAQQISTKAAQAINGRLELLLAKAGGLTPKAVLKAGEEKLRTAGLSSSKARSLVDLAAKVKDGTVPLAALHDVEDAEVVERLVVVRGIGVWTAQMFLIFSLGRLDVLPVGDFGLRAGVQKHYGLAELPGKAALEELARPWQPYRSIGTWYVWKSLGFVPQSEGR